MYLKANRSFVNLAAVEHVESLATTRGVSALKLTSDKNRELGVLSSTPGEEAVDLEKITAPVIPTGPVTTVICISPTGAITAAVIAGYRVCRSGLEPLFLIDPPADSTRFLSVGSHGFVRLDDGALYPNLEHAKAAVLGVQPENQAEAEIVEPMPKLAGRRR